jgi:hypothetical protein
MGKALKNMKVGRIENHEGLDSRRELAIKREVAVVGEEY